MERKTYGKFHTGDSYILLQVSELNEQEDWLVRMGSQRVWSWMGSKRVWFLDGEPSSYLLLPCQNLAAICYCLARMAGSPGTVSSLRMAAYQWWYYLNSKGRLEIYCTLNN